MALDNESLFDILHTTTTSSITEDMRSSITRQLYYYNLHFSLIRTINQRLQLLPQSPFMESA